MATDGGGGMRKRKEKKKEEKEKELSRKKCVSSFCLSIFSICFFARKSLSLSKQSLYTQKEKEIINNKYLQFSFFLKLNHLLCWPLFYLREKAPSFLHDSSLYHEVLS